MTAPPPPYPADTRAKGWRFELDYEQIEQSDTWALASQIQMCQHALLMMWMVAWSQVPCGSFPNDEELIRAKCRIPPATWAKCRAVLMRGWQAANDERLYHPTIAARVLSMRDTRGIDRSRQEARQKLSQTIRARDGHACVYCGYTKYLTLDHLLPLTRGGDNSELNLATACRPCNGKKRDRTPEECGFAFVSDAALSRWEEYKSLRGSPNSSAGEIPRNDTGTGTGTGRREEEQKTTPPPSAGPPLAGAKARALRNCPETFLVTGELQRWARENAPLVDIRAETAIFRGTERKTGITDWPKAWSVWMLREQKRLAEVAARDAKRAGTPGESTYRREKRERAEELSAGLVSAKPPGYKPAAPLVEVIEGAPNAAIAEH